MIVSKAFWKIVLKNLGTIVVYTIILVLFGSMNMNSGDNSFDYEAKKPSVVIFNHDTEEGITKGFVSYLRENATVEDGYNDDDGLKDALFYEQVILAIDIPENFHQDFIKGLRPEIKMRSSAGYIAQLAKVIVNRYFTAAEVYNGLGLSEDELVSKTSDTVSSHVQTEIKSKTLATEEATKANRYFSFASYSILACVITIICLVMGAFNRLEIRKRNLVSPMNYKKMDLALLFNSIGYALLVWVLYIIVGGFIVGFSYLWSFQGMLYIMNALVFCILATTVAIFISKLVHKKGAVSGVVNVVALGSSFLCGAFVPMEYLPEGVVNFAHVLPTYYYIDANAKIMSADVSDFETVLPIIINMLVVLGFVVVFVIAINVVSRLQRRVG